MLNINRVLFPTDYSATAESAFIQAAFIAERFGAELHVLNVVVKGRALPPATMLDPAVPPVSMTGRGIYQKAWAHGVPVIQSERDAPSAAQGILSYAAEHEVDLIVLGTHGRRGINRLLLGSVAEQVVRQATVPVYTVRLSLSPNLHHRPRNIVAPVDFSPHSRLSLLYAGQLARAYGGVVQVLHIVEETVLPQVYGVEPVSPSAQTVIDHSVLALREMVSELELTDVAGPGHVLVGHSALGIVEFARHHDVDLIVIGTHGRSGLARFVLGSVTEKVIRMASCPVFTVRSFGHQLLTAEPLPVASAVPQF